MAILGNLIVNLRSNAAGFVAGMNRARKHSEVLRRSVGALGVAFGRMAGAAVAAGGVVGIGALTRNAITQADKLDKLGIKLGETTANLSRLRHAAELSGVGFDTSTMALQRMARRMSEAAAGTGEARDALKELGLNPRELERMSPVNMFLETARAISEVDNRNKRLRLSMKLFDSEGVAMLQLIDQGVEGILRMFHQADQLGATVTDTTRAAGVRVTNAMTEARAAFAGLGNVILREFEQPMRNALAFITREVPLVVPKLGLALTSIFKGFRAVLEGVLGSIHRALKGLTPALQMLERGLSAIPGDVGAPGAAIVRGIMGTSETLLSARAENFRRVQGLDATAEQLVAEIRRRERGGSVEAELDRRQPGDPAGLKREVTDPQLKTTNKLLTRLVQQTAGGGRNVTVVFQ